MMPIHYPGLLVATLAILAFTPASQAATSLKPVLDGTIRDVAPKDGIPNTTDSAHMNVYNDPLGAGRGIIEFDLSLLPEPVLNATLVLPVLHATPPFPFSFEVYGYAADGALTLADWGAGDYLRTYSYAGGIVGFDVTPFIEQRIEAGDRFAGFNLRILQTSDFGDSGIMFSSIEYPEFNNLMVNVPAIPEPAIVMTLMAGLAGMPWVARRRSREGQGAKPSPA